MRQGVQINDKDRKWRKPYKPQSWCLQEEVVLSSSGKGYSMTVTINRHHLQITHSDEVMEPI